SVRLTKPGHFGAKTMFPLRVAATLALMGLLGVESLVWAGDKKDGAPAKAAQKNAADEKAIRALIAQLNDEVFEKRETAQKRLVEIGGPALELLKKAAKETTDAETRERATQLVQQIQESGLHVARVDFYHDFRKNGYPKDKFRPNGANAAKWIRSEPEGLRITIPADKAPSSRAAGVATAFTI